MRHRVRIQPYVSPATHRKLRAYSAAKGLTDSAVAEAALSEYFEHDAFDEPLIVQRLDGVARALAQVQHDLDVISQAFGLFARHAFLETPPTATSEDRRRADGIYRAFLNRISMDMQAGIRFAREVGRARSAPSVPTPGSNATGGRPGDRTAK
jgi:hypothetical protein